MPPDAFKDTFTADFVAPDGTPHGDFTIDVEDSTISESVFTQDGIMRIANQNLRCSVYYAVTGGPGGKGYMLIHPQDEQLSQNNSSAATALINFLGGLTADQFTNDGNQVDQPGVPQRYVIQSMAAVSLRAMFDFAAGTTVIQAIMTVALAEEQQDPAGEVTKYPTKVIMLQVGPEAYFVRPV